MGQQFDPLGFCGAGDEAAQCQDIIAQAAYFRVQRCGFEPGRQLEDFVVADEEVYGIIAGAEPNGKRNNS